MTEPKPDRCSVCDKPLRKCRHCGVLMGCPDMRSHPMHFVITELHNEVLCGFDKGFYAARPRPPTLPSGNMAD